MLDTSVKAQHCIGSRIAHFYKRSLAFRQWIPLVKIGKNWKKSNFSDFKPIFFLFGGVVTKNAFSKMFLTFRYAFFDTNLILWQHPQQVFYNFKNPFLKIFGKSIIFLIFWMFLHHPSKFCKFSLKIGGEIIGQSSPLLIPFFNFCVYSALIWLKKTIFAW